MTKTPGKILVAEDSPIQSEMLTRLLKSAGHTVINATNGKEALALLAESPVDMVISDVNMPEIDGIELCQRIRSNADLAAVKVLLVTTLSNPADIISGANAGADDYIIKPYRDEYLLQKVASEIATPRAQETALGDHQVSVGDEVYDLPVSTATLFKLLISTYENTTLQNQELLDTQIELSSANRNLEITNKALKASEQGLKQNEEKYRNLVTLLPDLVFELDADASITFINNAAEVLGWSPDDLIGMPLSTLFTSDVNEAEITAYLQASTPPEDAETLKVAMLRRSDDGSIEASGRTGEIVLAHQTEITRAATVGLIRDITRQEAESRQNEEIKRELEDRVATRTRELVLANQHLEKTLKELARSQTMMIQSEKMSALGTLIAGIAHQLNNPLMGAINYMEALEIKATEDELRDLAHKAADAVTRANDIIRGLLKFSRQGDAEVEPVDLQEVIKETLELFDADLRHKNIDVIVNASGELPHVMVNRVAIQQVVVNLITNARDAMENQASDKRLTLNTEAEQNVLRLSVADTGPGIPAEKLTRVFDAFYTTKPLGKGTGLGLALSANLIGAMGGRIWCEPIQAGAKFVLEMPIEAD